MAPLMYEDLSRAVIGAAIEVHTKLGPGFLESIYERALGMELSSRVIPFERQFEFTVLYKGLPAGSHRLDLLVAGKLVVELKATYRLDEVYYQTVRSYIAALGETQGLLLNFGTAKLQIKRVYNNQLATPESNLDEPKDSSSGDSSN